MSKGLYVHVPLCVSKCGYCGFYSVPYRKNQADSFCEALLMETRMRLKGVRLTTLYVGGGTPTVLPPSFWGCFMDLLRNVADLTVLRESTIETNPGTADLQCLTELRKLGFDRLSIGVQTFSPRILETMDRIHDPEQSRTGFHQARQAGFRNISIDLMYGVPGQTREDWEHDLDQALELGPEHISCYELTLEEGTPMYEAVMKGALRKPDDESCADMYFLADEKLTAGDYVHYEVSNYSRGNSRTSIHNCGYWRRDPYIGLGPSAHSFDGRRRRSWNLRSLDEYTQRLLSNEPAEAGSEQLTPEQEATERLMLGLRCCGGLDPEAIEKETGVTLDRGYLNLMLEHGRVVKVDSRIVPTAAGKLFADGDAGNLILDVQGFD